MKGAQLGLAEVGRFVVPADILDATLDVLQEAGRQGHEAFVLWGGRREDRELRFTSAIRPRQLAEQTPDGLLVTVEGESLFTVNKSLYERGEILAAQVHSHPGRAYHSETDDSYPLVTLLGALSLVVPDFARDGRRGRSDWAWYRLAGIGRWVRVDPDDLIELES